MRPTRAGSMIVWAVLVLALVAYLGDLGGHSLYLDESVSAWMAVSPWHQFWATLTTREPNMALYYVLLRVWVTFGHGTIWLRLPSVAASLGTVAGSMHIADRLFGRRAAILTGALIGLNPLMIELAQDARGYALSIFLVTAASVLFLRCVGGRGGFWSWTSYAVVSALAGYTNLWAILMPVAQLASLAFAPRISHDEVAARSSGPDRNTAPHVSDAKEPALLPGSRLPWRNLLISDAAIAVVAMPLGFLVHSADNSGTNWASGTSAGKVFSKIASTVPRPVLTAGVIVALGAIVWLVQLLRTRTSALTTERWPWIFMASSAVVPVALVVLASLVDKPLLVLRYLGICVPPALTLIGAALGATTWRWAGPRRSTVLRLALCAVLLCGSSALAVRWYQTGTGEDWGPAAQTIANQAQRGDGIVFLAPYMRMPFVWQVKHNDPGTTSRLEPVYPDLAWTTNELLEDATPTVDSAQIEAAAATDPEVWVVLCQSGVVAQTTTAVIGALGDAGDHPTRRWTYQGIELILYQPVDTNQGSNQGPLQGPAR